MRCAWLDHGDHWRRTTNPEETVSHRGRVIFSDNGHEGTIRERIQNETGKFVEFSWMKHTLVLSDVPIFETLCDEAERLVRKGSPVRLVRKKDFSKWQRGETIGERCLIHLPNPKYGDKDVKRGLILRLCPNDLYELTFDLDLWDKVARMVRARWKREREWPEVNKDSMWEVTNRLAENMGASHVDNFLVEHFLIWISAHDELSGWRATNKIIVHFARSWMGDPERYKKRFGRWTDPKILDRLDARLRKAVKTPKTKSKR